MTDRTPLQEIAKIVQGGRHRLSGNDFVATGFPAYGAGGLNGYLASFEFDREAIVLSAIGARCGKCFFARGKWSSLANTQVILPDVNLADAKFLWFQLNDERRWPRSGTGQPFIRPSDVKEHVVIIPPLPEQKRMAALLEKADRLRRTRRYARQLSDTFLQSVFLEVFGDPILNPKGWDIEHLEDVIDPERPITYGILKPGPNIPGGVRYVRVVDMQDGAINAIGIRRTTNEIAREYRRSTLIPADILLSIRGHVGRLAIVPPFLAGANITQDTARLAANGRICAQYLVECLRFRSLQLRMADLTRGAAVQGINLGDIKLLPIPVPPLPIQQEFADIVCRFERLRAQQREAERQAEHLIQTLLHRAFTPDGALN